MTVYVPPGLPEIIEKAKYKPGWRFWIETFIEDGEERGVALHILSRTDDSYDHDKRVSVNHEFLIPPASYNHDTWVAWLFDRIRDVESHEAGEFFMIDGVRVFGPHHGNGEDPYRVWHVGDYAATRKKAGQD